MKAALTMAIAGIVWAAIVAADARGDYVVLHNFTMPAGSTWSGGPMNGTLVSDGARLYGTTLRGGPAGHGEVYSLRKDGGGYAVLHTFGGGPADGSLPTDALVHRDGKLYGCTSRGGARGDGIVFSIDADGSSYRVIHHFDAPVDGGAPQGALAADGGRLYGVTRFQGPRGCGTVFAVDVDGSDFDVLHPFSFGQYPPGIRAVGGLLIHEGVLYGMTQYGGGENAGTVFALNPDGSGFRRIHEFSASAAENGTMPWGRLIAVDGALFGMTYSGGVHDLGAVFTIGVDGSGFSVIHQFAGGAGDGGHPFGALVCEGGTLYGMTSRGGLDDDGTLFSIETDGSGFTVRHDFEWWIPEAGAMPEGSPPD